MISVFMPIASKLLLIIVAAFTLSLLFLFTIILNITSFNKALTSEFVISLKYLPFLLSFESFLSSFLSEVFSLLFVALSSASVFSSSVLSLSSVVSFSLLSSVLLKDKTAFFR